MISISKKVVALVFVGVLALSTTVFAQDASKIGLVDVNRVSRDAPRFKQYDETLEVVRAELTARLDVRSQNLLLQDAEVQELVDLKIKAEPTDADKARMSALEQAEKDRDAELKTLQGTAELNDTQKTRLKELQDIQQKSKDTGTALLRDYEGQFQTRAQELYEQANKDLTDAITSVASAQALSIVLSKDGVWFGGTDITDAVIAALDRKAE